MRTAEDLLQELYSIDESHHIEAKRARQIDRSVLETVCAFANEPGLGGGYLLLGLVRDQQDLFGNAYQVEGVSNPDKLQSDLASQCASALNRPVRPRVSVEQLEGKTVIVAYVPEAAPTEKPIYLASLGLPRGAFRRVGSTDQEGSEDDLIALYTGHQVDTYDGAILHDVDLSDIDPAALDDYRQQRRQINPDAEELTWSNEDRLRALGCAQRDQGQLKPTVAGILLFGTTMALRLAETKGSGIRAMRELMSANGLLPPTFDSSRRPDQFVATFLFHHFLGPDDLAWLGRLTREVLSDEAARALVFVRELGAIDNAAYRAINRTDTLNASGHLRRLRDLGLLDMKGSGSRTYYVPGQAFAASLSPAAAPERRLSGGNGHQPSENGHHPPANGHHPLEPIPDSIRARTPPAGAKPRRDALRGLIQDLCRWRALSSREMAQILGKQDHKKLVRNYLSPMVTEGLLAYTIPEMENHPDQRYTVYKPND